VRDRHREREGENLNEKIHRGREYFKRQLGSSRDFPLFLFFFFFGVCMNGSVCACDGAVILLGNALSSSRRRRALDVKTCDFSGAAF